MPKKKTETPKDLNIRFTGKMSIIIEMEQYGPLEFRINDLDVVTKVAGIILDATDNTMSVNVYNTNEKKAMQKLLDGIE